MNSGENLRRAAPSAVRSSLLFAPSSELVWDGTKPIRLFEIKPERDGDSVEPDAVTVAPHEQVYLHVKMNVANSLADTEHLFRFHTDEVGNENRAAGEKGNDKRLPFVAVYVKNASLE